MEKKIKILKKLQIFSSYRNNYRVETILLQNLKINKSNFVFHNKNSKLPFQYEKNMKNKSLSKNYIIAFKPTI